MAKLIPYIFQYRLTRQMYFLAQFRNRFKTSIIFRKVLLELQMASIHICFNL